MMLGSDHTTDLLTIWRVRRENALLIVSLIAIMKDS